MGAYIRFDLIEPNGSPIHVHIVASGGIDWVTGHTPHNLAPSVDLNWGSYRHYHQDVTSLSSVLHGCYVYLHSTRMRLTISKLTSLQVHHGMDFGPQA